MLQVIRQFGNLMIKVEGDGVLDVFRLLAQAEDIFGNVTCGICGSEKVKLQVRKVKLESPAREFDSYEARCLECNAVLPFGVHADGSGLFCRAYVEKDGQRDYSTRGWRKIQEQAEQNEQGEEEKEEEPFLEEKERMEKAEVLSGVICGIERMDGTAPYPFELEFLRDGGKPGEEIFLPYFGSLPSFVRKGARAKIVVAQSKSGRYIKKFL